MRALASLLLPFRHYADFRGRSTRTEFGGFYLVTMLLNASLATAEPLTGEASGWLTFGLMLLLLCPTLALFVRRLHDSGRTGLWAAIVLPVAAINLRDAYVRIWSPYAPSTDHMLPVPVVLALMAGLLVLLVLLLWNDDPGSNRFGPNPRDAHTPATPEVSS
jgi:uncharacterized membrane protein YhaH (DUF805 family)